MAKPVDRQLCLNLIKQHFAGRRDPLVAFPDRCGFPNVVYLYDDDAQEMIDEVAQLMGNLSVKLKTPVVLFIEPKDRATQMAFTCDTWLKKW